MTAPLAGITVVDFSELLPGPFLTQNLCELGAEVIKIERPPHGDNARRLASGVFAAVNRGKRSVVADLKNEADRRQVLALIAGADIVVETYRPGVMARLGLDYASLASEFPRLIYASLTGYGQDGPLAQLPGHDLNYLAVAGVTALSGLPHDGPAHAIGLPAADLCGAMYGLSAVLAALFQRTHTGSGQHLDIAMADCVAHWMNPRIGHFAEAGLDSTQAQRRDALVKPAYGVFRTRDDQHLTVAALEDHFWARLCSVLDMSPHQGAEFATYRQRAQVADSINSALARAIGTLDAQEAERLLREADVPVAPVVAPGAIASFPQFVARGLTTATPHGAFARFPVVLHGTQSMAVDSPPLGSDSGMLK
jgi:CoA:oxalate CoA-transferase